MNDNANLGSSLPVKRKYTDEVKEDLKIEQTTTEKSTTQKSTMQKSKASKSEDTKTSIRDNPPIDRPHHNQKIQSTDPTSFENIVQVYDALTQQIARNEYLVTTFLDEFVTPLVEGDGIPAIPTECIQGIHPEYRDELIAMINDLSIAFKNDQKAGKAAFSEGSLAQLLIIFMMIQMLQSKEKTIENTALVKAMKDNFNLILQGASLEKVLGNLKAQQDFMQACVTSFQIGAQCVGLGLGAMNRAAASKNVDKKIEDQKTKIYNMETAAGPNQTARGQLELNRVGNQPGRRPSDADFDPTIRNDNDTAALRSEKVKLESMMSSDYFTEEAKQSNRESEMITQLISKPADWGGSITKGQIELEKAAHEHDKRVLDGLYQQKNTEKDVKSRKVEEAKQDNDKMFQSLQNLLRSISSSNPMSKTGA